MQQQRGVENTIVERTTLDAEQPRTANVQLGGRTAVILLLVGPVLYGAGLWAASVADGQPLTEAVCFDAAVAGHSTSVRLVIATAMAIGAFLLFFATPWLLGTLAIWRMPGKRATAGAWSLAVNSAALVVVCLILRNTTGLQRTSFLIAWLVWTGVLLWAAGGTATASAEIRSLWRRWGMGLLIGVAAVTVGMVLFHQEHFVQCFNGDGTEQFELAKSLRDYFLPYWEIEAAERFGTYIANPTVICSYWTLPWQLLLGEGELATRLPCWIWWLGIFAASLRMVQEEDARGTWLPAVPLALALLLTCVWYTFYVGYYPYMTDPASPGVLDALFTLLLLLALNCLRQGDCAGWVVSMILASLIYYAGPVVFLITAAAAWFWQPVPRRQVFRATLIGMLAISGIVVGYLLVGWLEGSLSGWWGTLYRECLGKYITPAPRGDLDLWEWNLLFVGYFLLGCGGIPAIGLLHGFWQKKVRGETAWGRTVATVTLVYLLFLLGSGHKNLHYLGPFLPVPIILWLKRDRGTAQSATTQSATTRWAAPLLAGLSLAVCIFLCWPASRPVFKINRELGAMTTFQTESYEEACRWGRIATELYERRIIGWQIGEHTWVGYSLLAERPDQSRPLLVTDREPPDAEHELVYVSPDGVKLYSCDRQSTDWLRSRHPQDRSVRFSWVLQSIAVKPRPVTPSD